MKNTFSRGAFEFQSETDSIFSTNNQPELVGSNPTLSAILTASWLGRTEGVSEGTGNRGKRENAV